MSDAITEQYQCIYNTLSQISKYYVSVKKNHRVYKCYLLLPEAQGWVLKGHYFLVAF